MKLKANEVLLFRGDYYIESLGYSFDFLFFLVRDFNFFYKLLQGFSGQISVGLFPSLENDFDFYLVALSQKFVCLIIFKIKVMLVGSDADPDSLHLNFFRFCLGQPFLLSLLVLEFSEIHDPADGGIGFGRNLDQVKFFFPGDLNGFQGIHFSQRLAAFINDKHLPSANSFVGSILRQYWFWSGPKPVASAHMWR